MEEEFIKQEVLKLAQFDNKHIYTLLISITIYNQHISSSPLPVKFVKKVELLDITAKSREFLDLLNTI